MSSDVTRRPEPDRRVAAFDALLDACAILDVAGAITHVNRAWTTFASLNGGAPGSTGVGANYLDTCVRAAAGGDDDAATVAKGLHDVLDGRLRSFEHRYPCPSPIENRWFVVRVTPLEDRSGALVSHLDVTAAKQAEDQLAHRAFHDPLTGLPNREAVLAHLRTGIARQQRTGSPLAALFLDLDGFKPVNDRYGHQTGDRVLARVANRIRRQLRASDVVGRVGGDEFLAVCDAADAGPLVDRLRDAVCAPLQVGGDQVSVGVSIGVAIADRSGADDPGDAAQALLEEADQAMYADKRRRRESSGTAGRR